VAERVQLLVCLRPVEPGGLIVGLLARTQGKHIAIVWSRLAQAEPFTGNIQFEESSARRCANR